VKAIAVIKDPKIYSHQYFILRRRPSIKIKILATVATTKRSVVADETAGELDQSEKKSLPAKIA
jgi:hypothetical protein